MTRLARIVRRPAQVAAIAGALLVGGVAVAATSATHDDGRLQIGGANDPLRVTLRSGLLFGSANSLGGRPVLTANGLLPGESRFGEVKVANDGVLAGAYTLQASDLVDTAGPNGGKVANRLQLTIDERRSSGVRRLYSGTPAGLRSIGLGRFASGEARIYRFTVTLPSGGVPGSATTGDNAIQGATARLTLRWVGTSTL